jgi:predicted RNase H-like HicB family nuclease
MQTFNKIILKDSQIVSADIRVKFYYDKDNNEVVARCAPLMITTAGDNLSHAKEMFKEAFELWIETVNEDCDAKVVLKNLGWKFTKMQAVSPKRQETFELPFLTDNSFKLNIPAFAWAS